MTSAALIETVRLDDEALDRLTARLNGLAAREAADTEGWAALRALARRPRLINRLDQRARAVRWVPVAPETRPPGLPRRQPSVPHLEARPAAEIYGQIADRFQRGARDPITVVITSFAPDGRVRERATAAMGHLPRIEYLPFLVLRTDDWAHPVRTGAQRLVGGLLDRPEFLVAALPMAAYLADRKRGGWALDTIRDRVWAGFDRFGPALLASKETYARRLGFAAARERGRVDYAEQVRRARHDADTVIRGWATEAACAEAVRRGDRETLRSLARSRFAGVRVEALVGLAKLGHDADVAAALDDPAALVRAYARSRTTDALARYRRAMATAPSPGSIAGLGETGGYADAALLTPLLASPGETLRAAAIRALAALDCIVVDDIVPLLHDPSPAVVREASAALRLRRTPPGLPWQLLADARPEVRRAGGRLTAARPYPEQVRAALLLAADADAALARRGLGTARRLLRGLGHDSWNDRRCPIPPAARPELIALAGRLGAAGRQLAERIRTAPEE